MQDEIMINSIQAALLSRATKNITASLMITEEEYNQIMLIYGRAAERAELNMSDSTNIGVLGLSTRVYNGLIRSGIKTIHDLKGTSVQKLMGIRNFGEVSVNEVMKKLKLHNTQMRSVRCIKEMRNEDKS